jgi:hypothetical protein
MAKKIDSISDDTWIELCNKYCLAEICRQVLSYREAVIPKLNKLGIAPQKYDLSKIKHSEDTKEKRKKSLIKYHKDNPEARIDQTSSIKELAAERKGKTLEEFYGDDLGTKKRSNIKEGHSYRANKSYKELFGEDRAKEICKKKSISSQGRMHTPASIEKMSKTRKEKMATGEIKLSPRAGCGLGGYREDIGHYVRSSYEYYFAKELQKRDITYKYEPKTFRIVVDGESTIYTPDFLIDDIYYELKNSYNITVEKFTKRLAAFREQYPDKNIVVIVGSRIETDYVDIVDRYVKG